MIRDSSFKKFVIYSELGMREKIEEMYPKLIMEYKRYQSRAIEEVVKRYQLE